MNNEYFFRVAGLMFAIAFPMPCNVDELLRSYRQFRSVASASEPPIFRLTAVYSPAEPSTAELLSESNNDLGHVRLYRIADGYRIEVTYAPDSITVHTLVVDSAFSNATAYLHPSSPHFSRALSAMIRILYAQAALPYGGISIHAACISLLGKGFLFLGKSGTGKSTHARRWLQAFPGSSLLNDDNPVLRLVDGTVMVYGTPWSGKTPCYKNEAVPVAAMVRLRQSPVNRFLPLDGPVAFTALLPSCSVVHSDTRLVEALHDTLAVMTELLTVGYMDCLPDLEAAHVCWDGIHASCCGNL